MKVSLANFTLIDLYSQRLAVANLTRGLTALELLTWLSGYGKIDYLPNFWNFTFRSRFAPKAQFYFDELEKVHVFVYRSFNAESSAAYEQVFNYRLTNERISQSNLSFVTVDMEFPSTVYTPLYA